MIGSLMQYLNVVKLLSILYFLPLKVQILNFICTSNVTSVVFVFVYIYLTAIVFIFYFHFITLVMLFSMNWISLKRFLIYFLVRCFNLFYYVHDCLRELKIFLIYFYYFILFISFANNFFSNSSNLLMFHFNSSNDKRDVFSSFNVSYIFALTIQNFIFTIVLSKLNHFFVYDK